MTCNPPPTKTRMNIAEILKNRKVEKTTAPHEVADCVDAIQKHVTFTEKYTYKYWLKKCKGKNLYDIEQLLNKMLEVEKWLKKEKKAELNRGGWLSKRL